MFRFLREQTKAAEAGGEVRLAAGTEFASA
jgi:hypothetical protein